MTGCSPQRPGRVLARTVVMSLAVMVLAVLAGCGGARQHLLRTEFIGFTEEQKLDLKAQAGRAYRIQEGDVLKVHFAYERNLNQDYVHVLTDGSVSLVGIDAVRLAGLTMAEADSALTLAYSREYREPALSVMMQETQGRRVYVLGQVRSPGLYKVPTGGLDVMSAISLAAGFTDDAAREGSVVVRVTPEGYQFQEVNLDGFGTADFAQMATITLQPYDIVYVPRSKVGNFSYFARSILAPLANLTRVVLDVRYITSDSYGRY